MVVCLYLCKMLSHYIALLLRSVPIYPLIFTMCSNIMSMGLCRKNVTLAVGLRLSCTNPSICHWLSPSTALHIALWLNESYEPNDIFSQLASRRCTKLQHHIDYFCLWSVPSTDTYVKQLTPKSAYQKASLAACNLMLLSRLVPVHV